VVTFGSGDPHQCGFADASSTQTKLETGITTDTAAVSGRFLRFSTDSTLSANDGLLVSQGTN
jgi:hypothetical protein